MLYRNEISLKMLSSKEMLDDRTCIICRQNGLLSLENIIQYYLDYGDFNRLKLISEYTNQKLIALCEKYNEWPANLDFSTELSHKRREHNYQKNQTRKGTCRGKIKPKDIKSQIEILKENTPDENLNLIINYFAQSAEPKSISEDIGIQIRNLRLGELAQIDALNSRAITCCLNYKLTNLGKILHFYYVDKKSFRQLRNCGKNTEKELIRICGKYSDFAIRTVKPLLQKIESKGEGITKEIPNFSLDELSKIDGLSMRAINSCNSSFNYELTNLEEILHFYYVEKESFKQLRCCGKNTEKELVRICEKYSDFAIKTANSLITGN